MCVCLFLVEKGSRRHTLPHRERERKGGGKRKEESRAPNQPTQQAEFGERREEARLGKYSGREEK